jgi:hypothetical protein
MSALAKGKIALQKTWTYLRFRVAEKKHASLQAQLRAGVVVEQRSFANVAPYHLHAAMAGCCVEH